MTRCHRLFLPVLLFGVTALSSEADLYCHAIRPVQLELGPSPVVPGNDHGWYAYSGRYGLYPQVPSTQSEVKREDYKPFSPGNRLVSLEEKPTLVIDADYPRIDGATSACPVYGAMVQMVYRGLDDLSVGMYVSCTTTPTAYYNLIAGRADMILGVHPSQEQLDFTRAQGKELVLTPIAKEGFVFFVNNANPVNGLTLEQIRKIYMKEIVNWNQVGGNDMSIVPFQRSANSGSQSAMIRQVMGSLPLPNPPSSEYASDMGRIIRSVALYHHIPHAIGYSFYFYVTRMRGDDAIKLLSINGVEPSPASIRSGLYPLSTHLYVITTGNETPNTKKLIDWLRSPQGQRLIEKSGYVPLY